MGAGRRVSGLSKKAAQTVITLQSKVVKGLAEAKAAMNADELAKSIGEDDAETVWRICEHLAANGRARKEGGNSPFTVKYLAWAPHVKKMRPASSTSASFFCPLRSQPRLALKLCKPAAA